VRIFLTKFSTFSTESTSVIEDVAYPQRVHWFPDTYDRTKNGLSFVPQKIVARLMTDELLEHVLRRLGKTAFLLAGGSQVWGSGGMPPYKKHYDNSLAYAYKMEVLTISHVFGSRIASQFGAFDYLATDATTCASSLKVMMDVNHLIKLYGFDRVIVLALEDSITNSELSFFGSAKANICLDDEGRGAVPSAFDSKNGGFYLGQGGCLAVFEAESFMNIKPRAELLGAYTCGEEFSNPLGQREDGQGYTKAIQNAIGFAGVDHSEIELVKTHGTGTPINNKSEAAALRSTLPCGFIATSYKQRIGHTVGASGLLETCLLLDDIKRGGMVPEIKNRTEEDKQFISSPTKAPEGLLLSLAAGMGNVYSAAIFDYYEHNKI